MALSLVSLILHKKILSIRKMYFYNNDEKTDMILICRGCERNAVAAVDTSNTFYIHLIC
jgi:hypothetical protein